MKPCRCTLCTWTAGGAITWYARRSLTLCDSCVRSGVTAANIELVAAMSVYLSSELPDAVKSSASVADRRHRALGDLTCLL